MRPRKTRPSRLSGKKRLERVIARQTPVGNPLNTGRGHFSNHTEPSGRWAPQQAERWALRLTRVLTSEFSGFPVRVKTQPLRTQQALGLYRPCADE
jgi:hypothetical protein